MSRDGMVTWRTGRAMKRWVTAWILAVGLSATAGAQAPADVVEYYHLDALGSVRAVTDPSGAVVRTHDYRPFGEGENPAGDTDPTRFTGKERDAESGLDYFGARYYASRTGRFTTVDPLMGTETALFDPQRWNRYSYVGNRPTRLVDPDGRGWTSAVFKVGKAVVKGGNLAVEFAGVIDDAKTLVSGESTLGQRGWAALSLASEIWSPVSVGDARGLASFAMRHGDDLSDTAKGSRFVRDVATDATKNWSATFRTEGEARALARTKLGANAVEVSAGKWRSRDGKWQYRAKPGDVSEHHIHLEELDTETGEVIQNVHLRWPEGGGR